ncbi:hypothetical protein GQ44DRAFT_698324 [Phaeosphaeriaceae sp. PMI808]|nr:hypothetical protein GQ44DRAFT_698324 [Phaeosphaeriaceae sp. PMI808]
MHDEQPHPLLAQVPLTISPFLSLPTSVPLPYSYKSLPSTLPPSILQLPQNTSSTDQSAPAQAAYVVSSAGTSATPDAILTSCLALQTHLQKLEADARRTLKEWEERRRAEDLAEKRRLAPGWLDNDVHILRPEESSSSGRAMKVENIMDHDPQRIEAETKKKKEGEELDRVFGGLKV